MHWPKKIRRDVFSEFASLNLVFVNKVIERYAETEPYRSTVENSLFLVFSGKRYRCSHCYKTSLFIVGSASQFILALIMDQIRTPSDILRLSS